MCEYSRKTFDLLFESNVKYTQKLIQRFNAFSNFKCNKEFTNLLKRTGLGREGSDFNKRAINGTNFSIFKKVQVHI